MKVSRFQTKPQPAMYVPHVQTALALSRPISMDASVHVLRDPARPAIAKAVIPQLRKAMEEMDPQPADRQIRTWTHALGEQVQEPRYYTMLLGIFAGVATLLATVGIYGIMAHSVAQRTREIGIRMALGAHWRDVIKLVLGNALLLIGAGLVVGLGGSLALTRLIATRLWGVTRHRSGDVRERGRAASRGCGGRYADSSTSRAQGGSDRGAALRIARPVAPFLGGDLPDLGQQSSANVVSFLHSHNPHALVFRNSAGCNVRHRFLCAQHWKAQLAEPIIGNGIDCFRHQALALPRQAEPEPPIIVLRFHEGYAADVLPGIALQP